MAALEPPETPMTPSTPINGTNGAFHTDGPSTSSNFEPGILRAYLLSLLPPMLGSTREELEEAFSDAEFDDRVSKFASESGATIYVVKSRDDSAGKCRARFRMAKLVKRGYTNTYR